MTAQIRPNRMEVSDRFPMLGFAVRTDQPDVEAEVVIATDIALLSPQKRTARTAANFYSSREHGMLRVPRGEGVFVVPPEVLARFIGNDRLFFGLATGRAANGGLHVDALPREGSPYVSLRGFTGRTLRRGFGAAPATTPMLEWTGDAAAPGSEAINGASAASQPANGSMSGSGNTTPPPVPAPYDDGFGPMPAIPARESSFRGAGSAMRKAGFRGIPFTAAHQLGLPRGTTAITMSSGTTAQRALEWIREKVEAIVDAVGDDVSPPSLYRLGSNSADFISTWETVLGAASWIPGGGIYGFLKAIPELARTTDVTLSVGPALDTPLFGGGVGVVFAPDGQVALFGQGDINIDAGGLLEFVKSLKATLQGKLKLGYNHSGLGGFESMAKVAGVSAGAEVVVGAEIWLDGNGHGLGGAVSVGVGYALQLAAQDQRTKRGVPFVAARQLGLPPSQTAITMSSGTTVQSALAWIREKVEAIVDAVGDDVSPPSLYRLGGNSAKFIDAWETVLGAASWLPGGGVYGFLKEIPAVARATGVTLSIGPALDTPVFGAGVGVVFGPDGQVALFGQGEISIDFDGLKDFITSFKASLQAKLKLGYNNSGIEGFERLGKVASLTAGAEIVVGAEVWLDSNGSGLGGAVSIGVGFALQLSEQDASPAIVAPAVPRGPRERANQIGGPFAMRIGEALDLGLDPSAVTPLLDKLEPSVRPLPLDPAIPATPMRLARPMSGTPWSVHWDGVYVIPQPNPKACWATTIAMLMGWRDQKSYDPATIAQQCGRDINNGLPWAERDDVARALNLGTVPPQCYLPEGFRSLIEAHGPLYVGKIMSDMIDSGHAVLVTGMYFDGTDHFVRVADPWDRGVGSPGAPDPYSGTHTTGSQYIMRFDTFMHEYEMAASGTPANVQIIYGGVPAGRFINTSTNAPAGYAMATGAKLAPPPSRPRAATHARQMDVPDLISDVIAGIAVGIRDSVDGDIDWHLPEWTGPKHPHNRAPATEAPYRQGTIYLTGWPSAGWRTSESAYAYPTINWTYNGTSIGQVFVEEGARHDPAGFGVTVRGKLRELPPTATRSPQALIPGPEDIAALTLLFNYDFQAPPGEKDPAAEVKVVLYADGTHEIYGRWLADESGWTWKSDGDGMERPRTSLPFAAA